MDYYDSTASNYNELHGEEQLAKAELILKNLKIDPNWELLDVGAGTGFSTSLFKCKKTCIDPSKELLKQNPFQHKLAPAENIPFPDHMFDIVISITAIHNFENPEKAIQEMKRVGKNLFVITVLKKSAKLDDILTLIQKYFKIVKILENQHDKIYILN